MGSCYLACAGALGEVTIISTPVSALVLILMNHQPGLPPQSVTNVAAGVDVMDGMLTNFEHLTTTNGLKVSMLGNHPSQHVVPVVIVALACL